MLSRAGPIPTGPRWPYEVKLSKLPMSLVLDGEVVAAEMPSRGDRT